MPYAWRLPLACRGLVGTLALCGLLAGSAPAGDDDTETLEDLNAEWVAMDRAVAEQLAQALPPGDTPVSELGERLGDTSPETRDIGAGGRVLRYTRSGGYVSFRIRVLAFEDRVVEIRVDTDEDVQRRPALEKPLRRAWPALERVGNRLRYRHVDAARRRAFLAAVARELGAPEKVDVPAQLRAAYERLADPLAGLDYGVSCYYAGTPPPGRAELEAILASGDVAVLRVLARSASPEGRVYAAEGLLRVGKKRPLTDEEKALVQQVRASKVQVACCDGCLVSRKLAAEALSDILDAK